MLLNRNNGFGSVSTLVLGLLVAGCGDSERPAASNETFVAEEYCDVEGLDASKRHTFIILDHDAVAPATNADEFVARNGWIRDAVLNAADPEKALARSSASVRERVSILLTSKDGGAATRLFTGCIPGLRADELGAAQADSSKLADFFDGGIAEELEDDVAFFRTRLVGALQNAGRTVDERSEDEGDSPSAFMSSLNSSVGLFETGNLIPRIILVSNVDKPPFTGRNLSREKGLQQGRNSTSPFRGADIAIVAQSPISASKREFLDAYFLAQASRIIYVGDENIGSLPSAPARVERFAGDAIYPDGPGAVQLRLASDANGKLVSSWIFLRHANERSVPIDGQAVCRGQKCTIRSAENGFSQIWSASPGGEPEFSNDMPFGGLRNIELTFDQDSLTGRIFDPLVDRVGPNEKDIKVRAQPAPDANF